METLIFIVLLVSSSSVFAVMGSSHAAVNADVIAVQNKVTVNIVQPKINSHTIAASINKKILQNCDVCHQLSASENNQFLPIIQGQNESYLASKIELFKNNKRSFHPFTSYFERLSDADIAMISQYYADAASTLNQPLIFAEEKNRNDELIACLKCHGDDGNGGELTPAISGQNMRYLAY